ncbi:MAG: hypothetical protein WHS87_11470 [Anaerolineales bacterium]
MKRSDPDAEERQAFVLKGLRLYRSSEAERAVGKAGSKLSPETPQKQALLISANSTLPSIWALHSQSKKAGELPTPARSL